MNSVRWQPAGETLLPGKLRLIDQTLLPEELVYLELDDRQEIWDAIKRLSVRGAPAIGCAAALGLAAVSQHIDTICVDVFLEEVSDTAAYLESSRPTAVNLSWALRRCLGVVRSAAMVECSVEELKELLVQEGLTILHEDIELCRSIGKKGVDLFEDRKGVGVLTHCNAGALATGDFGTALAPIYAAQELGLEPRVFADETRPLLQGARLTAWELQREGVDVTLICDNMAAQVMREGKIDMVIVGTDRVAANGDIANKIGTYGVAVLANYHNIPFYVAAPYSTIDMSLPTGADIPIEQRDPEEVRNGFGRRTAPADCPVYNPAFDVTPAELITGIITERGILRPPLGESIADFMRNR
jgi:methylthioribose-1-phosphate isomerase